MIPVDVRLVHVLDMDNLDDVDDNDAEENDADMADDEVADRPSQPPVVTFDKSLPSTHSVGTTYYL